MKHLVLLFIIFIELTVSAQQVMPLYEGPIPNSIPTEDKETSEMRDSILIVSNVSRPTLTAFFPQHAKPESEAVIVFPGGGYGGLAAGHEGIEVAKRLNDLGIVAFVLKYRIPKKEWMPNTEIGPLQDAQRAIQIVRQNAKKWKIRKDRIGILGFSAGGHLASTAATHFNKARITNKKKISLRPDFVALIYPVVSFTDSIGHQGSKDNLLGKGASPEKIREYSHEFNVTEKTPPTFLVHAKDDPVNYKNSIVFADALNAKGVFSEVLLFESGGHGFGLVNKTSDIQWIERFAQWLKKLDQ
jgi:acetyl esterase/lipase